MHAEAAAFLRSLNNVGMLGAVVYEVGALNVNGAARDHLPGGWKTWLGFDLVDGPGVDIVGDAIDTLTLMPCCDVLVSAEVLEHAPRWRKLVAIMADTLKSGGRLILTCAGPGRAPHAADGTDGGPHEGEHYENVALADLEQELAAVGLRKIYAEQVRGDTRYYGIKEA